MKNTLSPNQRSNIVKKTTLVSALLDFLLAVSKVFVGILSQSHALIADGIHSFSDLLSDALILFVAKHAYDAPDAEHPYGHERFETLATLALAALLSITAVFVVYDGILLFFKPEQTLLEAPLAFAVVIFSIITKEGLYWYTRFWAKKISSDMLMANAWHHRSDTVSSVIVLVSLLGTILGVHNLDSIAAILLGMMILHIAWKLGSPCVEELLDTAINPDILAKFHHILSQLDDVVSVHSLRTRRNGRRIIVDVHIQVQPKISVSEGHMVSLIVEKNLNAILDEPAQILVHIDPEDDENENLYLDMPNRSQIMQQLKQQLKDTQCLQYIQNIQLHYLGGEVFIDLHLTLDCLPNLANIKEKSQLIAANIEVCGGISLYFREN